MTDRAPITRHYVRGRFGQLHVRSAGMDRSGLPLVCLHQSPKSSLEFADLMAIAGTGRPALALDYPGYGMSDAPPRQALATLEAYGEAVLTVMDELGVGKAELLGNHTGAMVAALLGDVAAGRVARMTLISAPILTADEIAHWQDWFQPIPLDVAGTRWQQIWARVVASAPPGCSLEWVAASALQSLMGGEAYEWGHAAAFDWCPALGPTLARLVPPVLVLNPADDLHDATARCAALLANGTVLDCPDWGNGALHLHAGEILDLMARHWQQADGAMR